MVEKRPFRFDTVRGGVVLNRCPLRPFRPGGQLFQEVAGPFDIRVRLVEVEQNRSVGQRRLVPIGISALIRGSGRDKKAQIIKDRTAAAVKVVEPASRMTRFQDHGKLYLAIFVDQRAQLCRRVGIASYPHGVVAAVPDHV